jgi:hypothetical protein
MVATKLGSTKADSKPKEGQRKLGRKAAASAETIEKVFAYNMDTVVSRYAKNQKISLEDARQHEKELKRYFTLVIDNPGVVYGMCGPVDELWHTFLSFTLLYHEFCTTTAGRFLHHFPNDNAGDRPTKDVGNYKRFVRDYKARFEDDPPKHIWPSAMKTNSGVAVCSTCRCCIAVATDS